MQKRKEEKKNYGSNYARQKSNYLKIFYEVKRDLSKIVIVTKMAVSNSFY
jgi:hypothetical protein